MMKARPINLFIVALFCWLCLIGFDNHFDLDWRYWRCMDVGCTESQRTRSWVALAIIGVGFLVTALFAIFFITKAFFTFLIFAAICTIVVGFIFSEATRAGDGSIYDAGVRWVVGTFVIYITAPIVLTARNAIRGG